MKLFLLCGVDSTGQGGAPKSTLDLAVALKRRGHKITLAGNYSAAPEEKAIIKTNGIQYYEVSMEGVFSFPICFLRRMVRLHCPDMVITTHRGCDTMTAIALLGTGISRGSIVRMLPQSGTEHPFISDPLRNLLWFWALRSADLLVGISDEVVKGIVSMIGVEPSRAVRIYNAVDTEHFSPPDNSERLAFRRTWHIPENVFVVLIVGRLEPVKRPLDVIPIAEELDDIPLIFAYAGDGSLMVDIRQEFRRKGLQDKVLLLGKQSDMQSVYGGCDLLLHLGQDEAFGRVVIENYACGRPVVVVDSGGVRELVKRGETGYLFEPGDVVAAARSIRRLFADKGLYDSISKCVRKQAVEKFSLKVLGENYESVIVDALENHAD